MIEPLLKAARRWCDAYRSAPASPARAVDILSADDSEREDEYIRAKIELDAEVERIGSGSVRYVYVAGPLTGGDQDLNLRAAIHAASILRREGFIPFVPHLCRTWHLVEPASYEEWMRYDFAWVERCDAVVRLEGDSPGADREVELARSLGLPVLTLVEAVKLADAQRRAKG